jgi:hypothetical protein
MWKELKEQVGPLADSIKSSFTPALQALGPLVQQLQASFKSFEPILGVIIALIAVSLTAALAAVMAAINVLIPVISTVLQGTFSVAGTYITTFIGVLTGMLKVFQGVNDFLVGVFTGDWGKAWNGIKEIFSGVWIAIEAIFTGALEILKTTIETQISVFTQLGTDLINGLWKAIQAGWDIVMGWAYGLGMALGDAIGDLGHKGFEIGDEFIQGIWKGIQNSWDWFMDKVGGFFAAIEAKIPSWIPHSPSERGITIGEGFAQGIAKGMNDKSSEAVAAVVSLTTKMNQAAGQTIDLTGMPVTSGSGSSFAPGSGRTPPPGSDWATILATGAQTFTGAAAEVYARTHATNQAAAAAIADATWASANAAALAKGANEGGGHIDIATGLWVPNSWNTINGGTPTTGTYVTRGIVDAPGAGLLNPDGTAKATPPTPGQVPGQVAPGDVHITIEMDGDVVAKKVVPMILADQFGTAAAQAGVP